MSQSSTPRHQKVHHNLKHQNEHQYNKSMSVFDQNSLRNMFNSKYPAWLSMESTIEEINVNQQFFILSGCMTIFWKDAEFDERGQLQSYASNSIPCERKTLEEILANLATKGNDAANVDQKNDEENKHDPINLPPKDKQIINLNHLMDVMIANYPLPFVQSLADNGKLVLFKNALEFKFTGYKPRDLDYNAVHHVFKLQLQFKAKLYECFENNNNEFPFEWQFLNAQIPYRMDTYDFKSELPKFVKDAFYHNEEYKKSLPSWKHAALVRKLDNVDQWTLLRPWVDLRREDDYEHKFEFGLIKYRVRRNPHYYMLEMIIPLFLMVMCAFCVLLPAWNDTEIPERLSYIITLLLAVAAFQISIVDGMPYKSQFTLIDGYFLLAYLVLAGLVIEQSIEMSVDDDEDWKLTVYIGCVLLAIWVFHSLRFLFKWMTHSSMHWEYLYQFMDIFGIVFGFRELFICCTVKMSCCFSCCKRYKKKGRIAKWMQMEQREASTWDTTKKWKDLSANAELVLGTAKAAEFYLDTKGESDNDHKIYRGELVNILKGDKNECCGWYRVCKYVYSCSCCGNDSNHTDSNYHSCPSPAPSAGSQSNSNVELMMKDEKDEAKNGRGTEQNSGYGSCCN